MSDLREHLIEQMQAKKGKSTRQEKRLLEILQAPDSPRRKRQMARIERRVRSELGLGPAEVIDWSTIPWAEIFSAILTILLKLLPLLLL